MREHRYYKEDTYPAIAYKMIYENHQPVDIDGCTFEMIIKDTQPPQATRAGGGTFQMVDAPNGRFGYYLDAADTDTEGRFELIIKVTFPSGQLVHAPDPYNMVVQSLV